MYAFLAVKIKNRGYTDDFWLSMYPFIKFVEEIIVIPKDSNRKNSSDWLETPKAYNGIT